MMIDQDVRTKTKLAAMYVDFLNPLVGILNIVINIGRNMQTSIHN